MAHLRFIFVFFFICPLRLYAQGNQIPVRIDPAGGFYNSAVICQMFLKVFGDEMVESWLSEQHRAGFLWEVDSLGRIINFTKKRSVQPLLSKPQEQDLKKFIRKNSIHLCFHYSDPCLDEDDIQKLYRMGQMEIRNKIKNGEKITIYVPFNDELIWDYEKIKAKGLIKGKRITRTQYLRYMIHRYLQTTRR